MNTKILAVKRTAMMLAVCALAVGAVFGLFSLITVEQAMYLFGIGAFVFCVYMMYAINLGQVEYEETVKQREQERTK